MVLTQIHGGLKWFKGACHIVVVDKIISQTNDYLSQILVPKVGTFALMVNILMKAVFTSPLQ